MSSQNTIGHEMSNIEAEAYLNELLIHKNKFIGKPVGLLYENLENAGYVIRHMSTMSEGAWMPPDYTEYMTGIILYNKDEDDLSQEKNKEVVIVHITLDILGAQIDDAAFWRGLPDEGWMEEIKKCTQDMKVKDISFKRTKLWRK